MDAGFDYQPEDWYIDDPVIVPDRASAGPRANTLLAEIAAHALAELPLPDALRETVGAFAR